MRNLFFCLFHLLSFFCFSVVCGNTVVNGNKQTAAGFKKRALLVGIGNYLPDNYKNEYKEIRNIFAGDSADERVLENFEEFCDAENIDKSCARFLNNPNETTASEFIEIKNFYELVQKKKCPGGAAPSNCREPKTILAAAKNLYGDFILRKRNVSVKDFNLENGPHNDVLNMSRLLALKFEFDEIYVLLDKTPSLRAETEKEINNINDAINRSASRRPIVLLNEAPTNEVIKNAFRQKLTDSEQTCKKNKNNCDKSLFYFSGHGSQRGNPSEDNRRDETLVTLDVLSGKPDLRDDELNQLYNEALESRDLTVITDSCHSGDNYKAAFDNSKAKAISKDPRPVPESERKKFPNPIEKGLLWFGASSEEETAKSVPDLPDLFDDKATRKQQGNFTHHFIKTLMSVNDMAAREAFERTKSIMPVKIPQTPVADGFERNKNVNFFGGAINLRAFNATRKGESLFTVNGGRLYGLRSAIRLQSENGKICLEIKVARLTDSDAVYCEDSPKLEILGTTSLYQATWATPSDEDALKFWIPPAAAAQKDINLILEKFGKSISTDADKNFSHLLYFNGSANNWQLCPVGSDCQSYRSDSLPLKENDLALFIRPVDDAFRKKLKDELGKLNFGVKIVDNLAQSDYFLLGENGGNKFAWLNRGAIKWQDGSRKINPNESRMPSVTHYEPADLKADQSNLAELAQTLGKMHSWITLKLFSPPPTEENSPKLIVSKNNEIITTDTVITKGSRLRFSTASSGQKKEIPTKFFYLISFNEKGTMNFENESSDDKCTEKDCFLEEVLSVPENFGNKTLILLVTDKKILEARSLFNAAGVKTLYKNPLVSLISQMESGKKDAGGSSTFQNWSVDIFNLRFEAKKP